MTTREIWDHITAAVTELLADRGEEPGSLTETTKLNADLGISSVEAIHLMIMVEERLGVPLNFQELAVRDGEYVDDLQLGELSRFVGRTLGASGAATQ
jgi:acyl carrier protein